MTISLSSPESAQILSDIKEFVEPKPGDIDIKPDYSGMYQYIYDTFKDDDRMPQDQKYWFQQAAEINRYLNNPLEANKTPSAYFIEQMNKLSLDEPTQQNIQIISNTIGQKVYEDIIANNAIPNLEAQISNDIVAALDGGLSLSQWGGAFYYWDYVPIASTSIPGSDGIKSIGEIVVAANNVQQFVDMTSKALAITINEFGFNGEDATIEAGLSFINNFLIGSDYGGLFHPFQIIPMFTGRPLKYDPITSSDQEIGFIFIYNVIHELIVINPNSNYINSILQLDNSTNLLLVINPAAAIAFTAAVTAIRIDPLTLDLDGDGIETTAPSTTNPILFDATGNGIKTSTGWIKADDGLLVLDRNQNGTIDNGMELFGDSTRMTNGSFASDGFEALADIDSNKDGVVDAYDAEFLNLRVWRDLNQDGISQENELFTLTSLGISTLNTNYTDNLVTLDNGNQIAELGTYIKTDGSQGLIGLMADINLMQDTFRSQFIDTIPLTDLAKTLPNIAGSGQVRTLREAATLSPELSSLLTTFVESTDYIQQRAMVDQIIQLWAETSTMKSTMDGAYDGYNLTLTIQRVSTNSNRYLDLTNKLSILEKFNGRTYRPIPNEIADIAIEIPNTAETLLNQSYHALQNSVFDNLSIQTRLKPLLDLIALKVDQNGIALDFSALNAEFDARMAADYMAGFKDFIDFNLTTSHLLNSPEWNGHKNIADYLNTHEVTQPIKDLLLQMNVQSIARFNTISATALDDFIVGLDKDESIHGYSGNDIIYGNKGNDTINAHQGDDFLYGGEGHDTIIGGDGDDLIDGGPGNDRLYGNAGVDTYLFGLGSGQDVIYSIYNNGSIDVLQLSPGITETQITLNRLSNNLILSINNTTDYLTVDNFFTGYDIQYKIRFSDGLEWGMTEIAQRLFTIGTDNNDSIYGIKTESNRINGLNGNDQIYGGQLDDHLHGGEGLDIIRGDSGEDVLSGGLGNDTLIGGYGSDTYLFNLGDGQDIINNQSYDTGTFAVNDQIIFGEGISLANISIARQGSDLVLSLLGTQDKVTVLSHFGQINNSISQIVFNDGMTLTKNQINNLHTLTGTEQNNTLYALNGMDNTIYALGGMDKLYGADGKDYLSAGHGNDILDGKAGDDILIGGHGNDLLIGGAGSDVYLFFLGDGQDKIDNSSFDINPNSVDILRFEGLIQPENLWLTQVGNDLSLSVIGTTDTVTIANWYLNENNHLDKIFSADGKVLDANNVNALVDAMSSLQIPLLGQTSFTEAQNAFLMPLINEVWL